MSAPVNDENQLNTPAASGTDDVKQIVTAVVDGIRELKEENSCTDASVVKPLVQKSSRPLMAKKQSKKKSGADKKKKSSLNCGHMIPPGMPHHHPAGFKGYPPPYMAIAAPPHYGMHPSHYPSGPSKGPNAQSSGNNNFKAHGSAYPPYHPSAHQMYGPPPPHGPYKYPPHHFVPPPHGYPYGAGPYAVGVNPSGNIEVKKSRKGSSNSSSSSSSSGVPQEDIGSSSRANESGPSSTAQPIEQTGLNVPSSSLATAPICDPTPSSKIAGSLSSATKTPAPRWTKEDDEVIRKFGEEAGPNVDWEHFSTEHFPSRTASALKDRYSKITKTSSSSKGPWTETEDKMVLELVAKHGAKKWSVIASHLPGRVGKQCRERWHNHLNPEICKEAWKLEEDRIILQCHLRVGNRWAEMAKLLRGRYVASVSQVATIKLYFQH